MPRPATEDRPKLRREAYRTMGAPNPPMRHWLSIGRNESQRRKIGPIACGIPGEQRQSGDSRVRTDEEIGEDTGSRAAGPAILRKRLACEKKGRAGHGRHCKSGLDEK